MSKAPVNGGFCFPPSNRSHHAKRFRRATRALSEAHPHFHPLGEGAIPTFQNLGVVAGLCHLFPAAMAAMVAPGCACAGGIVRPPGTPLPDLRPDGLPPKRRLAGAA